MHRSYLIKPVSSSCNMRCKYCFYNDEIQYRHTPNYGLMNEETVKQLVNQTLELSDEITYAFQGGEPTLAGLDWFVRFVDLVDSFKRHQTIHYSIQTNGLCLDERWIDFFKKNNFLVGVSLDGFKAIHDELRGHFDTVIKNLRLLQKANVEYNILTVLSENLSQYPKEIYDFYKQMNFKYIQFIPCLPNLDNQSDYALQPKSFYSFYHTLFQLWNVDFGLSISMFEELITLFSGKAPRMCGMLGKCSIQYVIEASGNVYPCDFYCLDQYLMGNIHKMHLKDIKADQFLNEDKRMFKKCSGCKFRKVCFGNCKRMNVTLFDEEICFYEKFLEETYQRFHQLGRYLNG